MRGVKARYGILEYRGYPSVHLDGSGRRLYKSEYRFDKCGLAASRRTDKSHAFAFEDVKVDVVDYMVHLVVCKARILVARTNAFRSEYGCCVLSCFSAFYPECVGVKLGLHKKLCREGGLGLPHDVPRSVGIYDGAFFHDHDAVAEVPYRIQVVRYKEDGYAHLLAHLVQKLHYRHGGYRVERGCRFVRDEKRRVHESRSCYEYALPLSS